MTSLFGFQISEADDVLVCSCGHPPRRVPNSSSSGYARTSDGFSVCYGCAEKKELENFLAPETRFYDGYMDSREFSTSELHYKVYRRIITWSGGHLAWVWHSVLTRREATFGGYWSTIYATDEVGHEWTGLGQPGMLIRLRRLKNSGKPISPDAYKLKEKVRSGP